jgi:hypothetical protein
VKEPQQTTQHLLNAFFDVTMAQQPLAGKVEPLQPGDVLVVVRMF